MSFGERAGNVQPFFKSTFRLGGMAAAFACLCAPAHASHIGPNPVAVLLQAPTVQDPVDLALDRGRNRLYVADGEGQNLLVLQAQPKTLEYALEPVSFQGPDGARFPFSHPQAVAAPPGEVAVADSGLKRAAVFREDGRFLRELRVPGGFAPPFALAADPSQPGDLWLADSTHLYHFDAAGALAKAVPLKEGAEPGGLRVAETGDVWLVDARSATVQAFRPDGAPTLFQKMPNVRHPSVIWLADPAGREILLGSQDDPVSAHRIEDKGPVHSVDAATVAPTLHGSARMGLAWDAQDRLLVTQERPNPRVLSLRGDYVRDTDGDGLSDGQEMLVFKTDPKRPDTDGDGLTDYEEIQKTGTDALKADSDGDGYSDRVEITSHPPTDPMNRRDPLPGFLRWLLGGIGGLLVALATLGIPFIRKGVSLHRILTGAVMVVAGVLAACAATLGFNSPLPLPWWSRAFIAGLLGGGISLLMLMLTARKPAKP